jgi:hypothetical protein
MSVTEDRELERQLTECLRNGPTVQLVNRELLPVGAVIGDPNKTRADIPHPTPVLDALRAAVNNPDLSEQDREAAREVLRISFPWAKTKD